MNMSNITTLLPVRVMKALACVWLLVCATACDSSDETALPEQPNKSMTVSISIMTHKPAGTRAVQEYDRVGTVKENIIDVANGDYRVLVFHKDGWLVKKFNEIKAEPDTDQNTNRYLICDSLDITMLDFSVVVLANWERNGWRYPLLAEGTTTIDGLMGDMKCLFTVRDRWQPLADDTDNTGGIPMFGMHRYSVSREDALRSTMENPVKLAQTDKDIIWMVRSMAKIEVVDAMDKISKDDYPRLEKVTLSPCMAAGKLIPDAYSTGNSEPWSNGEQVNRTSLPAGITPTERNLDFFATTDTDGKEGVENAETYTGHTVYAAYVAEQDLTRNNGFLYITIRNRPDDMPGNGEATVTYSLDLSQDIGSKLLRNHIYRFEVKSASAQLINVQYVVCPWIEPPAIDIPTFD